MFSLNPILLIIVVGLIVYLILTAKRKDDKKEKKCSSNNLKSFKDKSIINSSFSNQNQEKESSKQTLKMNILPEIELNNDKINPLFVSN